MGRPCFLCGLFTGYIAGQLRGQFELRWSIRAEQQSSEKSCRVAGERILRFGREATSEDTV
jgi:hypothetical protein